MRIGIVGFGNLGKAVLSLALKNEDFKVVAIFSRRKISAPVPVFDISEAHKFKGKIDIMIMCGGSEKDLMVQTPLFAKDFNTIDTFDTHKFALKHFEKVNKICEKNSTTSIVCCGWDPGLFSIFRLLLGSIFDNVNCFYGKGISLGHTNALKKIKGVSDAKQYTLTNKKALSQAMKNKKITVQKHIRKCFVVAEKDHAQIKQKILSTPNYFKGEKTFIKFISQKTLNKKHNSFSHQGKVVATSAKNNFIATLKMQSNPEFTAQILLAYCFAIMKISSAKVFKAFTPLQIPVSWLSTKSTQETIREFC